MKDAEPITVVSALFEAIRRKRWKRAASLLHPDTRELVRKQIAHRIENDPDALLTVEMLRRHDPHMPIECVEYQIRRARERNGRNSWYRVSMGVDDVEELRAMDSLELTARLIEGCDIRVRRTRQTHACGPAGCGTDAPRPKFSVRWEVVGQLAESDDVALVIYRAHWFRGRKEWMHPGGSTRVLVCGLTDEGWRARNPDLVGGGILLPLVGPIPERPV